VLPVAGEAPVYHIPITTRWVRYLV
jgi:hypothetical protein